MPIVDFENVRKHGGEFGPESLEIQLEEARRGYETLCAAEGAESERAVSARGVLGELLFALHRYGEALEHWEGVTQQNMELYGEDDELTLEAAEYLALCLHRVGRGEEALDVCDQFGLDEDILDGRD